MRKAKLFIGSSVEGLRVAQELQAALEYDCESSVWNQTFTPGSYTLEALQRQLMQSDFGVFVFSPDDVTIMRQVERSSVRDNVILELGLFIGRLGRERAFFLVPRDNRDLHIPTDLLGITPLTYDPQHSNSSAGIASAALKVRKAIENAGFKKTATLITSDSKFQQFIQNHEGIRSSTPVALVVSLLPNAPTITRDVEEFLQVKGWQMPIESLSIPGIKSPQDLETLVRQIDAARVTLTAMNATEIHLFIAGPIQAGTIIGARLINWRTVKLYHKPTPAIPETYEYWMPLDKQN